MGLDPVEFLNSVQRLLRIEQTQRSGRVLSGSQLLDPASSDSLVDDFDLLDGVTTTRKINIPINAKGFFIFTSLDYSLLQVVGDQTGITYASGGLTRSAHFWGSWTARGVETSLTLIITGRAQGSTTRGHCWVVASVQEALIGLLGGPQFAVTSVPVVLAIEQAPQQPMARVGIVGITTSVLVPAVAGQSVYLFGGTANVATAVPGGVAQLLDTAATLYAEWCGDQTGNWPFEFDGSRFPVGRGLQWTNAVAAITS